MISVFLNLIYLLFTFMLYFLYLIYSKTKFEKEKILFFDLAIFSSYYICSRFGNFNLFNAFLINLPLIIAIYEKRIIPSLILSFSISFFLANIYNVSFYILIIEYVTILIISFVFKKKKVSSFALIKALFGILIIYKMDISIFSSIKLLQAILMFLIMYLSFSFFIAIYKKTENVIKMYYSLENIEKEKTFYESLFKITHEIKNPLSVCKGYLEMFNANDPKKANKYINIINQEIERTLILLKDFSDISKMTVDKKIIDITMLMEDVCDEVSLAFDSVKKFEYDLSEDEILIEGDYNRLKQVIINVVKNAKESILDTGLVFIEGKKLKKNYMILVKDNGIGMDKDTKNKIGTAFYTTKNNGTGLGVCLSKEIIERHGGTINYISKVGKGTTVKILLPVKK